MVGDNFRFPMYPAHLHLMVIANIRGPTEDIISYFTLMSSEIHYYDIIEKMGSWTLMSSEV